MTTLKVKRMNSITCAFPRIARQLNYRRSFPTLNTARVDIPCIPYEAFANTERKVWPWSLLRLFESVRLHTFVKNVSQDEPERSMLDIHDILEDHFTFNVAAGVEIKREFSDDDIPKFPVYVEASLSQVGNSSKTVSYELRHSKTNTLYAKCYVKDVLVSMDTHKPVKYPEWWLNKFSSMSSTVAKKPSVYENDLPKTGTFLSTVRVTESDIDAFKHTNWAPYIKFCYDSLCEHVDADNYETVSGYDLEAGVESFNMVYKGQSGYGDKLKIISWEKESRAPNTAHKTVRFDIMNGENICFQSDISFFDQIYTTL